MPPRPSLPNPAYLARHFEPAPFSATLDEEPGPKKPDMAKVRAYVDYKRPSRGRLDPQEERSIWAAEKPKRNRKP